MPRPTSIYSKRLQPMSWLRAFSSGAIGSTMMMMVIDCFAAVGLTPFCLEMYIGTMLSGDRYSPWSWTIGVFATWLIGGIFGFFYGYFFEYVFYRASAKLGILLGLGHAVLAAIALFPFFQLMHSAMGTSPRPDFGFFGFGMGLLTPVLLLGAHLLFGACMGAFYGPVHADRSHARVFEFGEIVSKDHPQAISEDEDHPDNRIVNW